MFSVASSCHCNGNSKNGKNRLQTNARRSGAIPTNPVPPRAPTNPVSPRAKARVRKPQGGGKVLVQIPEGVRGMVMDKIDTCINYEQISFPRLMGLSFRKCL